MTATLRRVAPLAQDQPKFGRCALHGLFRNIVSFGLPVGCYHCDADKRNGRTADEAVEFAAERHEERLDNCGLAGRYRIATFDTYMATSAAQKGVLANCRRFAESVERDDGGGLMLLGPCGTGKTHLLAAIALHLGFERLASARLVKPRSIVRRLRDTWGKGACESEADVIDDLSQDVDVMLLDEVGVGFGTEAEITQLYEVIDARYVLNRPTVVSSNLNLPALKAAVGDRIFDRLREGSQVLAMDWPSHRDTAGGLLTDRGA